MVLEAGQRFTLRDGTTTLATGVVTQILPSMLPEEKEKLLRGRTNKEREALRQKFATLLEEYDVSQA
jgi:translation elongation factor Tu